MLGGSVVVFSLYGRWQLTKNKLRHDAEAINLATIAGEWAAGLRSLGVGAIQNLPDYEEERLPADDTVRIGRYHERLQSGEHLVVVQVARERLDGMFASIAVEGFAISGDGASRPMTEPEKWPYT